MKEVMRIDRHGVKVNPEYSVDKATQHVLNALTEHIQHVINHAVAAEREACAALLDENAMACENPIYRSLLQSNADAIRARGKDPMPLFDDWNKDWK